MVYTSSGDVLHQGSYATRVHGAGSVCCRRDCLSLKHHIKVPFGGGAASAAGDFHAGTRHNTRYAYAQQSDRSLHDFTTGRSRDAHAYTATGDTISSHERLHRQPGHRSAHLAGALHDRHNVTFDAHVQRTAGHTTLPAGHGVRVQFDSLDDALRMVNETRPSYERKTSGKVCPLIEKII